MDKQGRNWRTVRWLVGGVLVVGISAATGRQLIEGMSPPVARAQETAARPEPPSEEPLLVVHPLQGALDRTTVQPGSIQAYESVQLYAGASGYLKTLNVDIGDRIKKGQILALVDVPELEKQVQRCAAVVEQNRARVAQMRARAVSARADWDAARAAVPRAEAMLKSKSAELRYRQLQLQRMRDLAASKSIEDKLVDETTSHRDAVREGEAAAQEAVTSAKANVAAMAARIQAADADIDEALAEVKVAQAELEKTQVQVRFATVLAPFDGVVTQRNFFPNDFVRGANEGGDHLPLLTVQRTDRMRVVVQVPDRDVPYCDPGDPAEIEIDALPGKKLIARISRISQSEDPSTRLMHVEIDLPNPTGKISNGMYGKATILLNKSNFLALPASCLVEKPRDGKGKVLVVRDGRVKVVPVTIGVENSRQIGVQGPLTAQDQVILNPESKLVDGSPVQVVAVENSSEGQSAH